MKIKSNPSLTLLTIVFGFLILNYFFDKQILLNISILFSAVGVFSKKISSNIEIIWFKLSFILSHLIPNVFLSIIYFFILTPLAILSRLLKSDTDFQSKNIEKSIFKKSKKEFSKKSFEKAW